MERILKGIRAVIFDMDGTLMDSMWMWKSIDIEYLSRYHIPMPDNLQRQIEGMGFHETAEYFSRNMGIDRPLDLIVDDWNQMAMDKYRHEVKLKPGAYEFLMTLRERKILTGIATSNTPELTGAALESNGITELFDCVCTVDPSLKGKPSPDVYLKAAGILGVNPEECLVFEDIPMGILAGKNAGMKVCAVKDDYCADRIDEVRAAADYYAEDFCSVLNGSYEVRR